jgi:hypothetical protein
MYMLLRVGAQKCDELEIILGIGDVVDWKDKTTNHRPKWFCTTLEDETR